MTKESVECLGVLNQCKINLLRHVCQAKLIFIELLIKFVRMWNILPIDVLSEPLNLLKFKLNIHRHSFLFSYLLKKPWSNKQLLKFYVSKEALSCHEARSPLSLLLVSHERHLSSGTSSSGSPSGSALEALLGSIIFFWEISTQCTVLFKHPLNQMNYISPFYNLNYLYPPEDGIQLLL